MWSVQPPARLDGVHLGETLSVAKFHPRSKDGLLVWSANRSFQLFISNLESRSHPTNWEITMVSPGSGFEQQPTIPSDGNRVYYSNRDFGMMFYARRRAMIDPTQ